MADGSISEDRICDNKEREFALLTISLYKDHPELWNPRCYDYSNKFMRNKALHEITEALKQFKPFYNEQLLRRKINILRTNFNKEFRKRERMRLNGHDYDEEHATLWYYDSLLFLKDEAYAKAATEAADGGLYKIKPTPRSRKRKLQPVKAEEDDYDTESVKLELLPETSTIEALDKSDSSEDSYPVEPMVIYDKDPLVAPQVKSDIYQSITEHDAVGINVAKKLAKMDSNQAIFAESIINNVLRRGLQKKLNDDTDLCDVGCGRVKYTLDNRILIKKN